MVIEHSALVGNEEPQSNPNLRQWGNKRNVMQTSSPSSQIREAREETRLRTGSGGAHFAPSGHPVSSAAEKEGSFVGDPTNAESNKQPRSEFNEDDGSEANVSTDGSQAHRRSSVAVQRSKKGSTEECDAEDSAENSCQTSTGNGG